MRVWIGRFFVVMGLVHCAAGLVFFGDVLPEIARAGVFNAIQPQMFPDRGAAFWYFFAGLVLLVFGGLIHHVERLDLPLPSFMPWALLLMATAGSVLMPLSGFPVLFIPVAGLFFRRRGLILRDADRLRS